MTRRVSDQCSCVEDARGERRSARIRHARQHQQLAFRIHFHSIAPPATRKQLASEHTRTSHNGSIQPGPFLVASGPPRYVRVCAPVIRLSCATVLPRPSRWRQFLFYPETAAEVSAYPEVLVMRRVTWKLLVLVRRSPTGSPPARFRIFLASLEMTKLRSLRSR